MIEAKHQVKRRIAKTSFVTLLTFIPSIFYLIKTANEHTAAALNSSSGILVMIIGCLTAIILAYMGITHHDSLVNPTSVAE